MIGAGRSCGDERDSEFAPCGVDGRVAGAMKLCAGSTCGGGPERLGDYRQDDNEVTKSVSPSNSCVSDDLMNDVAKD